MPASAGQHETPVKVKAALVDPGPMRVVWLNESAAAGLGVEPGATAEVVPIESVVPSSAAGESPREVLAGVAASGQPRHLRADMLASRRGSVAMLTSIYRLPDGMLMVITESTYLAERDAVRGTGSGSGRSR